jgi:hypothetical protein
MTYRGQVRNGAIVTDSPLELPEGSHVEFQLVLARRTPTAISGVDRFGGIAAELIEPLDEYHEHLLKKHA